MDVMMTGEDGISLTQKFRKDPRTAHVPIIVISAKDLTAAESERLKETVTLVMKKQGFEGEKLVAEINSALKQERLPT